MRNQFVILGVVITLIVFVAIVIISSRITRPMMGVADSLTETSEQISAASGQITNSTMAQAESASQQAAKLDEAGTSLEEVSSLTRKNADHTIEADKLMRQANRIVGNANASMTRYSPLSTIN